MRSTSEHDQGGGGAAHVEAATPSAGKRTLTASLKVQRRAFAAPVAAAGEPAAGAPVLGLDDPFAFGAAVQAREGSLDGEAADAVAVAEAGVAGAAGPLPHHDTIQRAFGHHDVGSVRAQVGGPAAAASSALGATAYATGDRVGFSGAPDLHTAAHEAAHVVQQRAGVQLHGGVGDAGDVYERHADQVADLVVEGRSAEEALDHRPGGGGGQAAVQRKVKFNAGTEYLDIDGAGAGITVPGYRQTMSAARDMDRRSTSSPRSRRRAPPPTRPFRASPPARSTSRRCPSATSATRPRSTTAG